MMEEDFYATIKLKNGEEIYAKVSPCFEEHKTMLLVTNPITVSEVKTRAGVSGYKLESWLKTSKDDMLLIDMNDVLTISESKDIDMIIMYQNYVRQSKDYGSDYPSRKKINRKMGYISNVNDAKEILEKLYKNS
jgi:hypothetical protein